MIRSKDPPNPVTAIRLVKAALYRTAGPEKKSGTKMQKH